MATSSALVPARGFVSTPNPATRHAPLLSKALYLAFWQISVAAASPLKNYLRAAADEDPPKDTDDPSLWLYLAVAAMLVLLGGAFAGLTIALMGQDSIYLQVIAASGEGKEQRHAQRVYRLLMRGKHWVLVTLLLSNVIVNETLPIVLDRSLGGGWPAVLGSTVLIVIFGEVIPQSICVRYGLSIGAFMAPFVLGLMWLMAPVAWPTAKLLDWLLGEDHGTTYKKSGLKTLVTLHKTLGPSPSDRLNQDEVTIISAVLDLKDKAIGDIMTPMDDVFTMSADTVLDEETMDIILTAGYSRIPIYQPGNETNFVGMLLVKILITYDPEDAKKVSDFSLATLPETRPETSCLDIVNFFQEGKSHMVLVSEDPGEDFGAIGVVTLEDVIEELIGEEIIDESDVYIDVHKAIRRIAPAPKTRVRIQRDHSSRDVVPQTTSGQLIDISEEPTNAPQQSNANATNGTDKKKSIDHARDPKTTFHRRASLGAVGPGSTVPVRGSMDDMREHLRHLGPSNLASRPKTTRYNTVKIKPGQGLVSRESQAESNLGREAILEEPSTPVIQAGQGDDILRSAGKDAKDGVQALQQGLTALGTEPRPESRKGLTGLDGLIDRDLPTLEVTNSHGSNDSSKSPYGSRGSASTDTISSLREGGNSKPRKKRATRSGSITENVVEAGGVRKVVLETNDSPTTDNEEPPAISQSSSSHGLLSVFTSSTGGADTGENGDTGNRSEDGGSHPTDEVHKKGKKKRSKKKKHGSTS